jgi:hypothetical protein
MQALFLQHESLRRMRKEAKTGQDAPSGANRFIITAR